MITSALFRYVAVIVLAVLTAACDVQRKPFAANSYAFCGESFCLSDVIITSAQTTNPVGDYLQHTIDLPVGRINIYEDNFPDTRGLTREPIPELHHLMAWHLTPTDQPTVLILVGAKWPHYLLVNIERDDASIQDLLAFLQHLTLTAELGNAA